MKISARNKLKGRITKVVHGPVGPIEIGIVRDDHEDQ